MVFPASRFFLLLSLLAFGVLKADETRQGLASTPFAVSNPNPFILIHGLPVAAPAALLERGESTLQLQFDLANHSKSATADGESVYLDGETYRTTLIWRRGLGEGWQIGVELPLVAHGRGVLDNFIEDWHDLFGFTNADRKPWPNNRLLLSYRREDVPEVEITHGSMGPGDIRLLASRALLSDEAGRRLTLNASLKLPTGDADRLRGSAAAGLALWLNADLPALLPQWRIGGYLHAGMLYAGEGEVLPDLQRNLIGFGGAGGYWHALTWLTLKCQLDLHSSFYRSSLAQLGRTSYLLSVGGSIPVAEGQGAVDLAIGENLINDTVPDFMLNLAYRRRF